MRDAEKDLQMCEAATPGKWEGRHAIQPYITVFNGVAEEVIATTYSRKDMHFIVEAREALPYWIDRAVSLEKEVGMLRDALEKIDIHIRSTGDPVPHIIQTLKDTLPEYKDWWDIGE